MAIQFFQHYLLDYSVSIELPRYLCQNTIVYMWIYFWIPSSVLLIHMSILKQYNDVFITVALE